MVIHKRHMAKLLEGGRAKEEFEFSRSMPELEDALLPQYLCACRVAVFHFLKLCLTAVICGFLQS